MNIWLLIVLMALVTFLPRYLPMALSGALHFPKFIERGLDFVPIAVLTAIIAQASLVRGDAVDISLGNHYALAAVAAFLVALLTRHLFTTIVAGLTCFALLRLFA